MKHYRWSLAKDAKLRLERGIGFEEAIKRLQEGGLLDDAEHPNPERYPSQRVYIFEYDGYAWVMPYTEEEGFITLRTIYPSRKLLRKYGGREKS